MSWSDSYAADWREGTVYAAHEQEQRAMRRPSTPPPRARLTRWVAVPDVAVLLGVSEQRVRLLVSQRRFDGLRHGPGRNRPWQVRVYLDTASGTYMPRVSTGKRGPDTPYAPRIPF